MTEQVFTPSDQPIPYLDLDAELARYRLLHLSDEDRLVYAVLLFTQRMNDLITEINLLKRAAKEEARH